MTLVFLLPNLPPITPRPSLPPINSHVYAPFPVVVFQHGDLPKFFLELFDGIPIDPTDDDLNYMLKTDKDAICDAIQAVRDGHKVVKYDDLPEVLQPVIVQNAWDNLATREAQRNRLTVVPEYVIERAAAINAEADEAKKAGESKEAKEAGEGYRRKFFEKLFTKEKWESFKPAEQELMVQRYTENFKEHVRVQGVVFSLAYLLCYFFPCPHTSRINSGSPFSATHHR